MEKQNGDDGMTENKEYSYSELENGQYSIDLSTYDKIYGERLTFHHRLCAVNFETDAMEMVELLNSQEERIRELEKELKQFEPAIFKYGYGEAILYIKTDGDV